MKTINKLTIYALPKLSITFMMIVCVMVSACDPTIDSLEFDLPEANSKEDLTPPSADFTAAVTPDYLTYTFANESTSATTYFWDFGDGNTSTDLDTVNTFPDEGVYVVTLSASDDLGVVSTYSEEITVVEPEEPVASIPVILEPGFDNGNDSRDPWRNSSLGGVIQITGSNGYYEGSNGAKLPASGDRIGYQEISEFTPNTNYILTYKYRFKDNVGEDFGLLHVLMLTATSNPADIAANTVASITYSEETAGTSELATGTLVFNSGSNTSLAIYFYNELDESYIDSFEIDLVE